MLIAIVYDKLPIARKFLLSVISSYTPIFITLIFNDCYPAVGHSLHADIERARIAVVIETHIGYAETVGLYLRVPINGTTVVGIAFNGAVGVCGCIELYLGRVAVKGSLAGVLVS